MVELKIYLQLSLICDLLKVFLWKLWVYCLCLDFVVSLFAELLVSWRELPIEVAWVAVLFRLFLEIGVAFAPIQLFLCLIPQALVHAFDLDLFDRISSFFLLETVSFLLCVCKPNHCSGSFSSRIVAKSKCIGASKLNLEIRFTNKFPYIGSFSSPEISGLIFEAILKICNENDFGGN